MTNQQAILDAFQGVTIQPGVMDVQHTPIYDTIHIAAGGDVNEAATMFFTNVGSNSGKTYADTNMTQSQKLMAPEAFSAFAVRLRWQEDILDADLLDLLENTALELYLGNKVYQRAPLWHFNAGGGVFTADQDFYANGLPGREAMHKLAIPIVIDNQMTFYAKLVGTVFTLATSTSGGTGLRLQLLLDGLYARGVQ